MIYTFRRAVREQVPLIIGLSGGTGSGKTYSAMRMAKGMAQGRPFCVIDTENGRASHYADQFTFDVLDLRAPFTPDAYAKAIAAADQAGYPVVVVDSMSHVWAGDGGVLDWQENELDRMAKDDYNRREACKMAAWIKPKMAHKHMMQTLLQVKAHLILCFRAEEKIEMVKVGGKLEVRKKESLVGKDGWVPICEKSVPFECTCSFLLLASNPGIPHPIKLQEQHKPFFSPTNCIDEFSGEQLAKWAAGGKDKAAEEGLNHGDEPLDDPGIRGMKEIPTHTHGFVRSPVSQHFPLPLTDDQPVPGHGETMEQYVERHAVTLRVCERTGQAITQAYNAIPDDIRQEVHAEYQKQLQSLNKKK